MIPAPETILIANIRLIGDVLLTTPLVGILHGAFPGVAIDLLVNRGTGELMEKDPRIRRVIYSDKWEKNDTGSKSSYLTHLFRQYDLAVSMNAGDRGAVAISVASRCYRVGYYEQNRPVARFFRKALFSHPLPFDEELHVVLRCRQIADALGLCSERLEVRLFWDAIDQTRVITVLAEEGLPVPYFVIHPFARWRYKYWDIERFAGISDRLAREYGLMPVWTSSPEQEEVALLQAAAARCAIRPLLVPGSLSLNQMACLLHGARLYIGLDTAITHIAASVGVPVVALYGPTELWRWHPWNNELSGQTSVLPGYRGAIRQGQIITLQAACEHQPCIRPHCYGTMENPCMKALSADLVYQEAVQLLESVDSGDVLQKGSHDC